MSFRIGKFSSGSLLRTLDELNGMTSKKQRKTVEKIIMDDGVMKFLFMPEGVEKNVSVDYIKSFYDKFTTADAINATARFLGRLDRGELDRTRTTFLVSLANMAIEKNNDALRDADEMRQKKAMSALEVSELTNVIEEMNEDIVYILKFTKKNVKDEAKRLADCTGLPVYICQLGLSTVPDKEYIDRFKVGFYLNKLLGQIYSDINEFGAFDMYDVEWDKYFSNIFGKDNVLEVCTFILLEGVGRIDKYKNNDEVKKCWNSLTDFALTELNKAPDANRRQMIELYIKRLERMFQNRSYDLRVDLTKISDITYPRLMDTIGKYADKITAILSKGADMLGE